MPMHGTSIYMSNSLPYILLFSRALGDENDVTKQIFVNISSNMLIDGFSIEYLRFVAKVFLCHMTERSSCLFNIKTVYHRLWPLSSI